MNDLISRKAAINAIEHKLAEPAYLHIGEDWYVGMNCAESELYDLSPAEPDQRWVLCAERLPDDLAEVNVTYVNHDPEPYYAFTKDKTATASAVYYEGNWYWYSSTCADYLGEYGRNDVDKFDDAIEVTAWRPFPEPYRGGDNNDCDTE